MGEMEREVGGRERERWRGGGYGRISVKYCLLSDTKLSVWMVFIRGEREKKKNTWFFESTS